MHQGVGGGDTRPRGGLRFRGSADLPTAHLFARAFDGCPALKHTRFPPTCAFTAHGAQRTWNTPAAETAPPAISNTETETASNNTAGRRAMPLSIGP